MFKSVFELHSKISCFQLKVENKFIFNLRLKMNRLFFSKNMPTQTLVAKDKTEIKVDQSIMDICGQNIQTLIDTFGESGDPIPLDNIERGVTLRAIVRFMQEYQELVTNLPDEERNRLKANKYEQLFQQDWVRTYIHPCFDPNDNEANLVTGGALTVDPDPTKDDSMTKGVYPPSMDHEFLFELMHAVHYLDLEPLMMLCARQTAVMITGKTPEEIEKMFDIKLDPPTHVQKTTETAA